MDERLLRLEARVDQLSGLVETLQVRLEALESPQARQTARRGTAADAPEAPPGALPPGAVPTPDVVGVLSLVGRLFIVLGGAFLLRALTENGTLAPGPGTLIGLAFAGLWFVAADRAAPHSPWSAGFHVLAAALVGFPLIFEAGTKFDVLGPEAAAVVLAGFAAVAFVVAWRRRQQSLAWIPTLGTLATTLALIAGTGQVVPFAVLLVALGTLTLWIGYSLDWVGLRWPVAAVANLVVAALTSRAIGAQAQDSATVTVAVQVLLVAAYLGSIGIRTVFKGRNVVPFEVVQTAAMLLVGLAGATAVARATGSGVTLLGTMCLVFGVASYAVTVRFLSTDPPLPRNVFFYSSVGLVVVLVGSSLLWAADSRVVLWAALGVAGCAVWMRAGWLFPLLHGAVYTIAAGVAAGVFGYGLQAIFGQPAAPWVAPSWRHLAVLAAALGAAWWASADRDHAGGRVARVPRVLIAGVLVWTAGGEVIGWLAPVVASGAGGTIDAGVLATLRTAVLSLAVLGIAVVGRAERFSEWAWFVYPLLVVIGLKMVTQDFPASRPSTLFVALALYGLALLVAPRLRRRPQPVPAPGS
jgi:hypothetical protein